MSYPLSIPRPPALLAGALALTLALTACSGNRAEIEAVCADIQANIGAVDMAAASIETDVLVDGVPYQDQHADELVAHLEDVEYLESLSRGDLRADATERADAVDAVLEELDFGDEAGLADALAWTADTHDMILAACGY
ncbi:hypothetical protein [Nocardiopsis alkaliphila]|uniref:hypothetical protein n=1 Tax=Nocardiopsis alkaliphila TaxID=225762 RepID=UPI00034976F9|nr:hypothetical protein [Nocardiopsis alkaliphila]